MKNSFVENGFIIDLSSTTNTTQLVFELSSVMEHPDVKGKRICLKLGKQDLKQSQLLSIKALIESMDAEIAFIDTTSEQTQAAAVSLGLTVSKLDSNVNVGTYTASENGLQEKSVEVKSDTDLIQALYPDTVEVHSDNRNNNDETISTLEGIQDIYTEESTEEISEIIPVEHSESEFEKLALNEGLLSNEDSSKYIILDTGDVLPEGAEENSVDTKTLPTLYLNQTLRSGQTVNYEGNILIIGDAHPGSEIIADGDITVWGILGGIAHAGSKGNITSKVRALKLNAIQLRIAGLYARRNDTLNVPYVQKTNEFTPEEAQIEEGKIVIYKKLRRD